MFAYYHCTFSACIASLSGLGNQNLDRRILSPVVREQPLPAARLPSPEFRCHVAWDSKDFDSDDGPMECLRMKKQNLLSSHGISATRTERFSMCSLGSVECCPRSLNCFRCIMEPGRLLQTVSAPPGWAPVMLARTPKLRASKPPAPSIKEYVANCQATFDERPRSRRRPGFSSVVR